MAMCHIGHHMTAAIAVWQAAQAIEDTAPNTAEKDDLHSPATSAGIVGNSAPKRVTLKRWRKHERW
ncbi:MAG: hypothetical protein AAGA01_17300 [Cyanobacteria bacterium P01_E01_bin.43]